MNSRASSLSSPSPRSRHGHAVAASFLGWTLDAFDFFVVIFLMQTLADQFHVQKSQIVATLAYTLAMRPVGAVVFGLLADRYGRRKPLMANVIFFSIIELLCGFAPNYTVFLILRTVYGIGMGGEWGVGASLAMEAARYFFRNLAERIFDWIPIGRTCREVRAACVGLAGDVLGWRHSRAACALCPHKCAGVRSVEATPRSNGRRHRAGGWEALETFRISHASDDAHDVSLPWYAGPVSGFP